MELELIREDVPKIERVGGSGREPEQWENHLAELRKHPGQSFRVWTYENKSSALSRVATVGSRLRKVVPQEHWKLAVRGVVAGQYGVYVTFVGLYTPEQMEENARKHKERSERVRASRAKTNGSSSEPVLVDPPTDTELSAKERVAAARAKAGK